MGESWFRGRPKLEISSSTFTFQMSSSTFTFQIPSSSFTFQAFTQLSLYSTRTQNTWRWGLALGNAPNASILRWGYQHVGIFWRYPRRQSPTPILKFALPPTPTPDASQWNIGGVGSWRWVLALGMYISCVR